jgi:hypothetical protein
MDPNDSYFGDHWYLPGPITEDTVVAPNDYQLITSQFL